MVSQAINGWARKVPASVIYMVAPIPAVWWFYLGWTGGLGPEPIKELEHLYGEFALQLLIAGLAVTPLRTWTGVNLIRFRRALGVVSFSYVALHLSVWLFLDMSVLWQQIVADIFKRPYITIGMVAFLLLIPLAATSNDLALRRLGPIRWRKLHKLVYPAILLGGVHYLMVVKGWQIEPMIYLAVIATLLLARVVPQKKRVAARA